MKAVPASVLHVVRRLQDAGYAAYLVGGCLRDRLLGTTPKDWDVATDARPEVVAGMFERTHEVGAAFGTVVVLAPDPVEVTTFRYEAEYTDGRHPSHVRFGTSIEDDLARRDFTINAMAWDPFADLWVDPFGGQEDLDAEQIRAVGDPAERFREDALRMLRAIRFVATLRFQLEVETWQAIEREASRVRSLSAERIRDELLRCLAAPAAGDGLWLLYEVGLMPYVLPELSGAGAMPQGKPGAPTLLAHLIQAVDAAPPDPILRFAALLHDVGKLTTRKLLPNGRVVFHGHEAAGEQVAYAACRRLRMPNQATRRVTSLVRMHMVGSADIGKKAIRRWVGEYGANWVRDLAALRMADHIASGGDPDANPFPKQLESSLDEVLAESSAFSLRDLAIGGRDVMARTGLAPGPQVGQILNELFERVLEEPALNTRTELLQIVDELAAQQTAGERGGG